MAKPDEKLISNLSKRGYRVFKNSNGYVAYTPDNMLINLYALDTEEQAWRVVHGHSLRPNNYTTPSKQRPFF